MKLQIFSIIQIICGIILIVLILLQTKGSGLGSAFGGGMTFYQTRRGVEKLLFYATMVVAGIFLLSSLLGFIL